MVSVYNRLSLKSFVTLLFILLFQGHFYLTVAQDSLFLKRIICELSAPEMFGRGTPYQGDLIAANYIQNELELMDVQPLGDSYFQNYPIFGYDMSGDVYLILNQDTLQNFYDYRLPFHTPSMNGSYDLIEAPLLILDYTIENDKVVFSKKAEKVWKKWKRQHEKQLQSEIIYFDIDQIPNLKVDSLTKKRITDHLNEWKIDSTNLFGFKQIAIGTQNLPGFGTRPYPVKNFSIFYIKPEFVKQKQNTIQIHFENKMGWRTTQNVCGVVEGTQFTDSFIVFIGHYDHLGLLGDSCVFYGAFDNASGTAYVLAFAQYFKKNPLKYSTLFILASGEESGLQGSTFFVNNPLIPLENIKLVLNFDLMCGGNDGILFFNGIDTLCKPFLSVMEDLNDKEQWVSKIDKRRNIPNSDHFPFTQKRIPALFALTMGGQKPPTHHPEDKCESCGVDASEKILQLFIRTLENF